VGPAEDLERLVGERLEAVRRHRGLSLRELAKASGLSLTTVHQIETGRTSPGLSTLHALASALGVPLGALLDGHVPPAPAVHLRQGERPGVAIPCGRLERLASGLASQRLRGLLLTLEAGRETGGAPIAHAGQELVFVLEGTCRYEVGGERYLLRRGDSLLFEGTQPHRAANEGARTARLLLTLYAPEEEPRWIEPHVAPARGARRGRRATTTRR
jgi:transcriptional regulator with XRE-family HTH domain